MQVAIFKIKGMTCDHCAQTIAKKFSKKEGLISKDISYPSGTGKFEYDPEKISKNEITALIDSTGHYKVEDDTPQPKIETAQFAITGMTCNHCAQIIDKKFHEVTAILNKEISYPKAEGKFTFDSNLISKDDIKELIDSTGHYKVESEINHSDKTKPTNIDVAERNNPNNFDLIILGGGSAAFSAAIKAESLGLTTLMVNGGLDFGGTCVNVGCVPSKNLIRAAETVYHTTHSNFAGIKPKGADIDFARLIKDKKKLVATLQQTKYMDVVSDFQNLTMVQGWAEFVDNKTIVIKPIPNPSPREGSYGYEMADKINYNLLKEFAKENRKKPTRSESILWQVLKGNKLNGYHFRRQHIIGNYIADFICLDKKLIIEIDGLIHQLPENKENDLIRTAWLEEQDFKVSRFTNDEVLDNIDDVLRQISEMLKILPSVKAMDGTAPLPSGGSGSGLEYTALKFLIATGATTNIPNIKGLKEVNYLTNISLFDLEEQPESMIVLGGGYIALEIAQAYHRLGTKVTLLQRSAHVLSKQTAEVANELTSHLRNEGMAIYTGLKFIEVSAENAEKISVVAEHEGNRKVFEAEKILVSTGTKPNTTKLGLQNIGLALDNGGHISVNDKMETNLSNIYAAGDCINTPAYVYTAAFEGRIAVDNAFAGTQNKADYSSLPWVVFTDPQVAGAGLDEEQAEALNIPFEVSKLELKDIPRAIAAHDTRGFIKLIRNTETDQLIGARVVAPDGGELIQQLSMVIKYGISVNDLVESFYPYLTLGEGIKLAAITFAKDISKLSCCAS